MTKRFLTCVAGLAFALPAFGQVDWTKDVWKAARAGENEAFLGELMIYPDAGPIGNSINLYEANLEKRELNRAEAIAEARTELTEKLAEGRDPVTLSEAMVIATRIQMLDDQAVDTTIQGLIQDATRAARDAEQGGDWIMANELYYRLRTFHDNEGLFEDELTRQSDRLHLIQLYAPSRCWEIRNERRLLSGEDPLPPFNPKGQELESHMENINRGLLLTAIRRTAQQHVETEGYAPLMLGGLDSVRTLVSTHDLDEVFPGLGNRTQAQRFLGFLDDKTHDVRAADRVGFLAVDQLLEEISRRNRETVNLPEEILLREFGNGAMRELDRFSAIIWPDEMDRFRRNTQGSFVGVGVQIQLDELHNIKVVTPLEGTPAQRAGIRAGDIIKRVDGDPTVGFTLDQAVEVITGPVNTRVVLTVERDAQGDPLEIDVPIKRAAIDIKTVKGWRRAGAEEDNWDWFIDPARGIGYVRLTQFTDATTREFDKAVNEMKRAGLEGLILDLRFNPGGLLNQAVSITNRFVEDGPIVSTENATNRRESIEFARAGQATVNGIPVVVLINNGSASASEIVSGAIQDYAAKGDVQALVVGDRSFGKGSVQNVWPLGRAGALKLTTQYYRLPGGRLIHKKPGASEWGVDPNLEIEMLPDQWADSITLRRDLDVLPLDENGDIIVAEADRGDPNQLLDEGIDLQLQSALVLLQTQSAGFPDIQE